MIFSRFRNASVFKKLTLSYAIIVVFTAALIGLPLYRLFSSHYRQRILEMNSLLLDQYASLITTAVIDPVRRVYVDMSLNVNLRTDINQLFIPDYSHATVLALHRELLPIVNTSEGLIEAIHFFSVENEFIVSTMLGLKYNHELNRYFWPEVAFISNARDFHGNRYWTYTREISYTTTHRANVATFFGVVPPGVPFSEARGIVAIDIREERIGEILGTIDQDIGGRLMIFNGMGGLVADMGGPFGPAWVYDFGFVSLAAIEEASGTGKALYMGNTPVLISSRTLYNGWVLVNAISLDAFYAVTRRVAIWTFSFSISAVILCMWLSRRFMRAFTLPLKNIIARIRHYAAVGISDGNEFSLIDEALTDMYSRITNMSQAWESNLPAIKQNLLKSLINQTYPTVQDFYHQIRNLGELPANRRYGFMLVNLRDREDTPDVFSIHNQTLIRHIEGISTPHRLLIAAELSIKSIGVLMLSESDLPESILAGVVAFANRAFGIDIILSVGSWHDNPLDVYLSYRDAEKAGQHYFFQPQQNIFNVVVAEKSPENDILDEYIQQFKHALLYSETEGLPGIIQTFIQALQATVLSSDDKHEYLAKMTAALAEHTQKAGLSDKSSFAFSPVGYPVENVTDIHEYEAWLGEASERVCTWKRVGKDDSAKDIIESIKQYIHANLGKELSLTSLSEYTTLSNSYISYIFKEKTGVKLVDYITRERMTNAKEMLANTSCTIESIARQLGYHTPHYFTKRFRQYYGMTPVQYRNGFK